MEVFALWYSNRYVEGDNLLGIYKTREGADAEINRQKDNEEFESYYDYFVTVEELRQ